VRCKQTSCRAILTIAAHFSIRIAAAAAFQRKYQKKKHCGRGFFQNLSGLLNFGINFKNDAQEAVDITSNRRRVAGRRVLSQLVWAAARCEEDCDGEQGLPSK